MKSMLRRSVGGSAATRGCRATALRRLRPLPSFIGWELLVLSVAGLLVMPVSGFWLVFAVAIYTIVMARRSKLTSGAAESLPG